MNGLRDKVDLERFQGEERQKESIQTQLYIQKQFELEIDPEQLVQF